MPQDETPPLAGKTIVVTGAGRGIGAAVALESARNGAQIVVNDRDAVAAAETAERINRAGGAASARPGDISDWAAADDLMTFAQETFGRLDGLVNMAGVFRMESLLELGPTSLDAVFASNVAGSVYCARHAAERMAAQGGGSIVNVVSGAQMGMPRMGVYGAAKGAMASFTYAWALELQDKGVRVNAVSPLALTQQVTIARAYQAEHGVAGLKSEPPDPKANAGVFVYLLSEASKGVTGQIVRIEGGLLSLMHHPMIAAPVLARAEWDYAAVRQAFEQDLGERLAPLGVAASESRIVQGASRAWD
nr:SDR family oxidoreductase [uncultured Brevundimonas sp.]